MYNMEKHRIPVEEELKSVVDYAMYIDVDKIAEIDLGDSTYDSKKAIDLFFKVAANVKILGEK